MIDRTPQLARLHQALLVAAVGAAVRHDLRTRLASIRNAAFYLRRKVEAGATTLWTADPRVPSFFELIDRGTVDAEQSLAVGAPLPAPQLARVDLAALIAELAPAGPAIELRMPARDPLWVDLAADELEVALGCVVDNALEAAPTAVVIACARRPDGTAAIDVTDDAVGFAGPSPAAWLAPFATSKPGHLGLGLPIAHLVATRAGATLELAAAGPHGARATLVLPAPRSTAAPGA